MRAIAVSSVILFHFDSKWLPGGYWGVDIFFVISGFIISSIIYKSIESNNFNVYIYFANRVKRILPAYLVMLMVVSILCGIIFLPKDFSFYEGSLKSSIFFNANNYFYKFGDYFAPKSHEFPLMHLWSLAVEMQFYLIFPFLFFILKDRRQLIIFFFLLSVGICGYFQYYFFSGNQERSYFLLLPRFPEFLIGAIVGISGYRVKNQKIANINAVLGILIILYALIFLGETEFEIGFLPLLPCVGVLLLISSPSSFFNKLISCRFFLFVGAMSYSLYLWHWPVLALARYFFQDYELTWKVNISVLFFIILVSWISFRFVENLLKVNSKRSVANLIGLLFLGVIVFAGSKALNIVSVPAPQVELTRYENGENICHGKIVEDCIRGGKGAEKRVLLIGDSHAAQLNIFADIIGKNENIEFKIITASSCVTIPGFDVERIPDYARLDCMKQISHVKDVMDGYDYIMVAGLWTWHLQSQNFIFALKHFLQEQSKKNRQIILFSQVPEFSIDPQRLQRLNYFGVQPKIILKNDWFVANEEIEEIAKNFEYVKYFDMSKAPIFQNAPYFEGKLIFSDGHHLNEVGSEMYGEFSRKCIKKWLNHENCEFIK